MMQQRTPNRLRTGLAVLALLLGTASAAHAEDPRPIVVDIDMDSSADASLVRSAIEKELGSPTTSPANVSKTALRGSLKVHFERPTKALTVSWTDARGAVVSRSVVAPDDASGIAATSALLAGNLVRDQTTDVLSALKPAEKPAEPSPPPTPPAAAEKAPAVAPAHTGPLFPANLAFFYPIATNMGKPDIHTYLDVGALYTRVGSVDGAQASGIFGRIDGDLRGAQASGILSTSLSVRGLQGAGIASVSQGDVRGAQFSGITNVAGGDVIGAQGAPINVANDVTGAQFGVVNVGHKVRGLQLGVVNVADDVDGAAIGVVSISKTGHTSAVAWASQTTYANLGVKFASKYIYTIINGAYHNESGNDLIGYGFALGGHVPVVDHFFGDIDVAVTDLWRTSPAGTLTASVDTSPSKTRKYLFKPRILAGYEFTPAFAAFGGWGLAVAYQDNFSGSPKLQSDVTIGFQLTP